MHKYLIHPLGLAGCRCGDSGVGWSRLSASYLRWRVRTWAQPQEARGDAGRDSGQEKLRSIRKTKLLSKKPTESWYSKVCEVIWLRGLSENEPTCRREAFFSPPFILLIALLLLGCLTTFPTLANQRWPRCPLRVVVSRIWHNLFFFHFIYFWQLPLIFAEMLPFHVW